jgi:hypothetical protein
LKRRLALAASMSLTLIAAIPSGACSMASCLNRGVEMRRDFAVTITNDGKPLPGVAVQITSNGSERFSGVTLTDGTVRVVDLPPGDYWLNAELLGISAAYQCFHVGGQPSRKAKRKLTYEWGDEAPATRRIAGRLLGSQLGRGGTPIWNLVHRVDVPISGASLTLHNPISGEVYSATSSVTGDFAFDTVSNGTYVLHVEGGSAETRDYDATDLLIELSPSATRNVLLLTRREGGCGGTYLDFQNTN